MLSVIFFLLFTKVQAVETYICGWDSDRSYNCKLISEEAKPSSTEPIEEVDHDDYKESLTFEIFSSED